HTFLTWHHIRSIRSGVDGEVEDDNELLFQEQKSCRARARKFSLETNRRRKALEERRRQWDVQEQLLRENILQQRKQRLLEDTERFQRAHLPPSQKRRPASSKAAVNLDEALSHIHGALGSYAYQSSFLSSASNLSRSGTSSAKPPGGSSGSRNLRALSAAETYVKLVQERNSGDFRTSQLQEAELPVEDSEQARLQEHNDAVFSCTESLSSLDSLEPAPELLHKVHGDNPTCCPSSSLGLLEVQDAKRPSSPQGRLNCPSSNNPPRRFLEEVLSQQGIPCSRPLSPVLRDDESSGEEQSVQDLTHAVEQCSLAGQSQGPYTQATPSRQQDSGANAGHMTSSYGWAVQGNTERDKGSVVTPCKTQTAPDTTPLEFSRLTQESNSSIPMKAPEGKHAKHPPVTDAACRYGKGEDLFCVSSGTAASLNAPSVGNPALLKAAMDGSFQSHRSEADGDGIISKREARLESYVERCKRGDPLVPIDECTDVRVRKAAIPKSSSTTEEPEWMSAKSVASPPTPRSGDVRFLKGILKKQSKYVTRNVKLSHRPEHFVFTRQVAMSIRDSMELARAKVREPDSNEGMKKKLRWFDEVNGNEEEDEGGVGSKPPTTKNQLNRPPQQPLPDHLQGPYRSAYLNVPTAIPKTSMTSTGPDSTRQAWADGGYQEGRQQVQEESRPKRAAPHVAAPRVIRRVRSGHVSSRARRGTIIRPQSTSEAQHVIATQGVTMVPRPPPRSEVVEDGSNKALLNITRTAYNEDCPTGKPGLVSEEAACKNSLDSQPLPLRHVLQTEEASPFSPAQPSYAYTYETVAKGVYALFQSNTEVGGAKSGPPCEKNGICLDRTPTDEEISLLWHGVRSALASKDGEPRSFLTNGPLSASAQARANLSHVAVNGIKAVTRMGGIFLTPSNSKEPKVQTSNLIKNIPKTCLLIAIVPISGYKTDQIVHDEGPVVMESDGQAALDVAQSQRAGLVQQKRGQAFGLSALSLEEQKLLQSLDRLNERLHNVQDVAMCNAALKGVFALDPAYVSTLTMFAFPLA
ncbi:hypothetical protein P4O66_018552, partial [Electrophorus voltai]